MWGDFLCDYKLPYVCEMAPFPRPRAPPAPAPCPAGYIASGENCYFFSYDVANYADAENACETLGGVLACIKDQMEDEFIRDHLVTRISGNMDYWIGYHDRGAEAELALVRRLPLNVRELVRGRGQWNDRAEQSGR